MKKLVKILVPFLLLTPTVLAGCGKDKRIALPFCDIHVDKTSEVSVEQIQKLINDQETFFLTIYSTGCACWTEFKPNLDEYVKENHVPAYIIAFNDIGSDIARSFGINYVKESTTTFAIFEKGTYKTSLNSSEAGDTMKDKKSFYKYMNETVRLPGCYLITKDDYFAIKESGKSAVIYFARSGCGDCTAINEGILDEYFQGRTKPTNKIYVVDCQKYWAKSSDTEAYAAYLAVKKELGMSTESNPTFGYGSGVFPFFSFISGGEYKDGSVIYNDEIKEENGKYTIDKSYYSSERVKNLGYTKKVLEGKELKEKDLNISNYGAMWKHESADKYYKKILDSFLNTYLPKVDYTF